jgi:hypothetical protein
LFWLRSQVRRTSQEGLSWSSTGGENDGQVSRRSVRRLALLPLSGDQTE